MLSFHLSLSLSLSLYLPTYLRLSQIDMPIPVRQRKEAELLK